MAEKEIILLGPDGTYARAWGDGKAILKVLH
jgi:hypothetical protein